MSHRRNSSRYQNRRSAKTVLPARQQSQPAAPVKQGSPLTRSQAVAAILTALGATSCMGM